MAATPNSSSPNAENAPESEPKKATDGDAPTTKPHDPTPARTYVVKALAVVRDVSRRTALLREQASTRDELSQWLFGLGMSLRSVIQGIEAAEPARRIEVVVDGMSDVVDALESETQRRSAALLDDEN